MKKITVFVLLLLTILLNSSLNVNAAVNDEKLTKIDEYVNNEMKIGHIPGVSIGIVYGDEIIYLKGYGVANSKNEAVTPDTPFFIGSVGKTLTALAIRQLANQGLIDVNASVETYIPWFTIRKPNNDSVTINDLVYHKSGFSNDSGNEAYTYNSEYSIEEIVKQINDKEQLVTLVGDSMEYSNLNFIVLGLVVEYVSGISYDDYLKENVFTPLNMVNSFTSILEAKQAGLADGYRQLLGHNFLTEFPYPTGQIPAGYQISTAKDMTNLLIAYLNNGYYNETSIIPNNSLPQLVDPLTPYSNYGQYYNNVWDVVRGNSLTGYNGFYGYLGATPNFNSALLISQKSKYGVVVLANNRNPYATPTIDASTIGNGITNILLGYNVQYHDAVNYDLSFLIIPALCLLFGLYRLFTLLRFNKINKSYKRKLSYLSLIIIDLAFPLLLLILVPIFYSNSWFFFVGANPELGFPIFSLLIVLLLISIDKIGLTVKNCLITNSKS